MTENPSEPPPSPRRRSIDELLDEAAFLDGGQNLNEEPEVLYPDNLDLDMISESVLIGEHEEWFAENRFWTLAAKLIPGETEPSSTILATTICRLTGIQPSELWAMPSSDRVELLEYLLSPKGMEIEKEISQTRTTTEPPKLQSSSSDARPLANDKRKRSTERGEGRAKLIAALTKHHRYSDGSCLNPEPIGNNNLARLAGVSESTASAFFNKEYQGHAKYRAMCRDAATIVAALKLLNQEFSPHHLYGNGPPETGIEGNKD